MTTIPLADLEKVISLLRYGNEWAVRMVGSTVFHKAPTIPEALAKAMGATKIIADSAFKQCPGGAFESTEENLFQ